jgi:DNA polymerase-3 subunit delta
MPILTRDDLRSQLKRREVAPVYVLFGAETYLRDLAAKYIADLSFNEGEMRDFNETEFSLNTPHNIKSALSAAEQLPMLASKRVIRIVDVRVAATGAKDSLKEEHELIVTEYLKRPAQSSVVIFIADELNGNRKIGRLLRENSTAVEFKRLENADLVKWARDKISDAGCEADERTVRFLVDLVGNDVRRLTNEIEKLSTAALPGRMITLEMIESLVPNSRELTNFTLTDNLMAGRGEKALSALRKILDDGSEPLALLGLIASNYRRLLIAKEMMARGDARSDVVTASKAFGGGQDAFLSLARRTDTAKLTRIIRRIAKTDLAIKTSIGGGGPQGSRMQIEMLVCELAVL